MVNFHCGTGPDALPRALEMGLKASKAVTSEFKAPNELEFEKVPRTLDPRLRILDPRPSNPLTSPLEPKS